MPDPRSDPFALVFGDLARDRFPVLQQGIEAVHADPHDRDCFLLVHEVAELLRELRPQEGVGDTVQMLAGLLHYAYLFWLDGQRIQSVSEAQLTKLLLEPTPVPAFRPSDLPTFRPSDLPTSYVQLPALRVWATPLAGQPPEPLDGWFVTGARDGLALLAIFGLHPGRAALTAVELSGSRPGLLERADGSALFSPSLAGGTAARLASVDGEAELLELAWRVQEAL